jgi:hypothetical protein
MDGGRVIPDLCHVWIKGGVTPFHIISKIRNLLKALGTEAEVYRRLLPYQPVHGESGDLHIEPPAFGGHS